MISTKRPWSNYSLSSCALCFLDSFLPLVMLQHDFLNNSVYTIYIDTYIHVYVYTHTHICVYTYSYNSRKLCVSKSTLCILCCLLCFKYLAFDSFYLKELWQVDFVLNCVRSECSVSDDCWIETLYWLSYALWHN